MTFDDFIKIGQIRSFMRPYKKKKEVAINVTSEQLLKFNNPYVAISGGKDSSAMACIIKEALKVTSKSIRVWGHVSDASFPGTGETIKAIANMLNAPLDLHISEVSAFDVIGKQSVQGFGKKGYFFDSVREYAKDKDLAFVGVRAKESKRRMKAAKANGQVFYSRSMGDITICHPVLWFTLEDVAAIIYEYGAPLHPIYSKMSVDNWVNSNGEQQFIRLGYATSKDLLTKGTAVFIKLNYPDIYTKLKKAYPEIDSYT